VVDDDRAVRAALGVNLGKAGHDVAVVQRPSEAHAALADRPFDLVLTDVRMPEGTGMELLAHIKAAWPDTAVVVMTGYGSVADAVAAMKAGAEDYLIKPVDRDALLLVVDRALARTALRAEVRALRQEVEARYGFHNLVGATPAMVDVYEQVAAVADTSATVLLQGETGTGKELIAHAIHWRSRRASGPFVAINCAALPEGLLESELFGHEKGAFSGAVRQHRGRFEQADGGTLLLDEIGDVSPAVQIHLLRVLQNGEVQRVGGAAPIRVDVRVLAATNKDLRQEVVAGRFRQDLFYRLQVVRLQIPALRERREDIPLLVAHFVRRAAEKHGRPAPRVGPGAMADLMAYAWPGNVRQLEHVVEQAVVMARGGEIDRFRDLHDSALPDATEEVALLPPEGTPLQAALLDHERRVLIAALREAGGVQARAARRLGITRSNLNYRIARLGIALKDVAYE
jgi:DNA-binding NtrC family response regulator